MITKCSVCRKKIDVPWPHLWTYKRGSSGGYAKYMCSYSCLRAYDDMKGMNQDMSLSKEQRQTVIDMAMRGESPLTYIEEQGIKNPSCTWWNIRKYMSKNDPETYAKLPASIRGVKAEPKKQVVETPENNAGIVPIKHNPKKFPAVAIEHPELGEFHYSKKFNYISWKTDDGDEIVMAPEKWMTLINDWPDMLEELGVGK